MAPDGASMPEAVLGAIGQRWHCGANQKLAAQVSRHIWAKGKVEMQDLRAMCGDVWGQGQAWKVSDLFQITAGNH